MIKKVHRLVEVQITRGFEIEEKVLDKEDKKQLTGRLNNLIKRIRENGWDNRIYRTKDVKFPSTINREKCSLYLFNGTNKHCVVLSYEDDPLFKQKIVTLYRVVERERANSEFSNTLISLYKEWM